MRDFQQIILLGQLPVMNIRRHVDIHLALLCRQNSVLHLHHGMPKLGMPSRKLAHPLGHDFVRAVSSVHPHVDRFPKNLLKLDDTLQFLQTDGKLIELLGVDIVLVVDRHIHNAVKQPHKKEECIVMFMF